MQPNTTNHNGATWPRFKRALRRFRDSSAWPRGLGLFALLICLLVAINLMNVLSSYVGRDWISAIEHRSRALFIEKTWLYGGIFAALTVATAFYRFAEERLALLWRDWQTRELLGAYFDNRAFYKLAKAGELENPDQRIAEDVRTFTITTLSFVLMLFNGGFTVLAFSGVLWSISPRLFIVAVIYALLGTGLTILLGRPLVQLNNRQLDKEASFRSELIHVGENADAIALLNREDRLKSRLLMRLDDLVSNMRRMTKVNRNVGMFTTGYSYLIQLIPALVVAPLFIDGQVEFGVITQSAVAFTHLMGAFSLIVTQFQSISSYVAVIGRLDRLADAMDHPQCLGEASIEIIESVGDISFEHLTLTSDDGTCLINDLNLSINSAKRVLVTGASGFARVALFKATAGLSCRGSGCIRRPHSSRMLFLAEHPYLPKGTLRELLLHPSQDANVTNDHILRVLESLQIERIAQTHGLTEERDWNSTISLGDQALIAVARVLLSDSAFVFFDRMTTSMDLNQSRRVLKLLAGAGIGYFVLGKPNENLGTFDAVLQLERDASWSWQECAKS